MVVADHLREDGGGKAEHHGNDGGSCGGGINGNGRFLREQWWQRELW